MLEERPAPRPGGGADRWWAMAEILKDCRAVLVSGIGDTPQAILSEAGVEPVVMTGFIEMALNAIYGGRRSVGAQRPAGPAWRGAAVTSSRGRGAAEISRREEVISSAKEEDPP